MYPQAQTPEKVYRAVGNGINAIDLLCTISSKVLADCVRVILAEGHTIVCKGLSALLSKKPGIEVVAEAEDGWEAVRLAEALHPDVILIDVRMEGLSGFDTAELLLSEMVNLKVIILSQFDLQAYRDAACALGASA